MEKKIIRSLHLWFPLIIWCLAIFLGSSLAAIETSQNYWSDFFVKKTVHLFEYFTLYILAWRVIKNYFPKRFFLISLLFVVLYAASDEIHQSFVPGREPGVRDVIIDAGGGVFGLWFLKNLLPKMPARLKTWLSG